MNYCFNCALCNGEMRSFKRHYFGESMVNVCEECHWDIQSKIEKARVECLSSIFKDRPATIQNRTYTDSSVKDQK
jgi:hypothetical protein